MEEWVLLHHGFAVYLALFLMLMGGAIGLPIPEDIPLILAGIVAQLGNVNIFAVAIVCYCGILLGDTLIFFAGRKFGPAVFKKEWVRKRVSPHKIRKIRLKLERRSILMIFIARHLFYMRTVTFLTCGAVKMHISRFLIADAIAALVSAPIMIGIGYFAAENYETIVKRAEYITLGLVIVLLFYLLYKLRKDQQKENNKELEVEDQD